MNTPLPAPRTVSNEVKKPVPTPRRTKITANTSKNFDDSSFSRKARQKLEDLGEGTRQSLRKLSRRFSSASSKEIINESKDEELEPESLEIFNSITFNSPLSKNTENIYNNIEPEEDNLSNDSTSLPPPTHPPPPLPDESAYDAPSSIASNSTSASTSSNSTNHFKHDYETVYPKPNSNEFVVADDSGVEQSLSRSGSWKFYDSVAKSSEDGGEIKSPTPVPEESNVDESCVLLRPSVVLNARKPSDSDDSVDQSVSSVSGVHTNSVYENYVPPNLRKPSKSIIFQFDPLTSKADESQVQYSNMDNMKLLEQFLHDDIYGTTTGDTLDSWSLSTESIEEEFLHVPTPPTRVDSLPEVEQTPPDNARSSSQWFDSETPVNNNNNNSQVLNKKEPLIKKFLNPILKNLKSNTDDNVVKQPEIFVNRMVQRKGRLFKVQNNPVEDLFKEYSSRWCVLENSKLICYSDPTCGSIKEYFDGKNILSVQIIQDSKYKYRHNNNDLHCLEINVKGKTRGGHIYGTRHISEIRVWLQAIADSLSSKFPTVITSDYTRFGWAYIREGLSGVWSGAWICLKDRTLYYACDKYTSPKNIDLRKARCIVLQAYQEGDKFPSTNDKGPIMLINCPNLELYFRMWTSRETKMWCHLIKLAAHNNGANLDEQQLTKHNIPVIVETCMNFIYLHGSMMEGIYRKPGINSAITEILTSFRSDAFSVHLNAEKYSANDVATALKRFFRDLPQPLISTDKRQYLYQVSKSNNKDEKIRMFKAILEELPEISYKVTRKILGHLHFISTQREQNLMTIANLASIWGPTLLHSDGINSKTSQIDTDIVSQLIELCHDIFPEDQSQLDKEKAILQVLKKYSTSPQFENQKNSGDLRVWIYLFSIEDGTSVNIAVGPNKTAFDVASELCEKVKMRSDELIIKEVVLDGKLHRPVHHTEKILEVVLRWANWDEADRKNNHLVLTRFSDYGSYFKNDTPTAPSGLLKFADPRTRFFREFQFDFSAAKLRCYKDTTELSTWKIEEIIWYLGHESKRNPSSKWSITFIDKESHPNRTRSSPYFGNTLIWNDDATRSEWIRAMLKAQYGTNLLPPVRHINLS